MVPKALKDPLWVFLLFGASLFGVAAWSPDKPIVEVTEGDIQRLIEQWRMQMRRDPTATERQELIHQFIREEVYYQEALALNLDAGDTVVKRRMIQKLAFLTEDLADTQAPSNDELQAFYQQRADNYRAPEQFSFRHIYFSADRKANSQGEQAEFLAAKAVDDPSIEGDPFMLQRLYAKRSQREIGDLFGNAFAENLSKLVAQEQWQGPLRSAFGWHAVQLIDREPASAVPFNQVRDKVLVDWKQQRRRSANAAYLQDLLKRYDIRLPPTAENEREQ